MHEKKNVVACILLLSAGLFSSRSEDLRRHPAMEKELLRLQMPETLNQAHAEVPSELLLLHAVCVSKNLLPATKCAEMPELGAPRRLLDRCNPSKGSSHAKREQLPPTHGVSQDRAW